MIKPLSIADVLQNNKEWASEKLAQNPKYFEKLAQGQNPDILYIGCADSRVTAEELMGAEPGQVFIHRNIANLVPATDLCSLSVIEFAIKYLQVKHIIVCGHYECGGVKAAMQPKDLGLLNPWLRVIRDVYRSHHDELAVIAEDSDRFRRLVELNVEEQCIAIMKTAAFQTAFLNTGSPRIYPCVFDIHDGHLKVLPFCFEERFNRIREIYDLGLEN